MKNEKAEKRVVKWTLNNSLPYLIACALPTVLLVLGFIPAAHWTVTFVLLVVGVGLVDMKSIDIAGAEVDFEEDGTGDKSEPGVKQSDKEEKNG